MSQISLQEIELEGSLGEGQLCGLLVESVRRAVGKEKGWLSESKESPRTQGPFRYFSRLYNDRC